jgi:hypothetical protein
MNLVLRQNLGLSSAEDNKDECSFYHTLISSLTNYATCSSISSYRTMYVIDSILSKVYPYRSHGIRVQRVTAGNRIDMSWFCLLSSQHRTCSYVQLKLAFRFQCSACLDI